MHAAVLSNNLPRLGAWLPLAIPNSPENGGNSLFSGQNGSNLGQNGSNLGQNGSFSGQNGSKSGQNGQNGDILAGHRTRLRVLAPGVPVSFRVSALCAARVRGGWAAAPGERVAVAGCSWYRWMGEIKAVRMVLIRMWQWQYWQRYGGL
jgi:hypothetical protein